MPAHQDADAFVIWQIVNRRADRFADFEEAPAL